MTSSATLQPLTSVTIRNDSDIVAARQRARHVASALGFDGHEQTRIATVASELARCAIAAGGARFNFAISSDRQPVLVMTVSDQKGPMKVSDAVAANAQRLMDGFEMDAATGVTMIKRLPPGRPFTNAALQRIVAELEKGRAENPVGELQRQNEELLTALGELKSRRGELESLNEELEATNRGVLALYAELDDKAESLRRADHLKSRFLSDMSHEFRTPVNAILALTRLLDEEPALKPESRKQVSLIRSAAEDLEILVNDLLDLAKIEAGKVEVRPAEFAVADLFASLRGILKPLQTNPNVALVFEEAGQVPHMITDEAKVSQILRNFISNALKFTDKGEVRVSATLAEDGRLVTFAVADTGIGIAQDDLERIFEEFTQIENPLQRRHKGTGLGLPLTRRLASLLGGGVSVTSVEGVGSTFFVTLPLRYGEAAPVAVPRAVVPPAAHILVVDDDETARYTVASFAIRPGVTLTEAENGLAGLELAKKEHPDMIFLDLMMPGMGGHEALERLKGDPETADIPVVVITSRFINEDERKHILLRARQVIYKGDLSREVVGKAIDDALRAE